MKAGDKHNNCCAVKGLPCLGRAEEGIYNLDGTLKGRGFCFELEVA
jgi:hypothetical protein